MNDHYDSMTRQQLIHLLRTQEKVNKILLEENDMHITNHNELLRLNKNFALDNARARQYVEELIVFAEELLRDHPHADKLAAAFNKGSVHKAQRTEDKFIDIDELDKGKDDDI
jgi:hypothetical protein